MTDSPTKRKGPRILVVGWGQNAEFLSRVLNSYGFIATWKGTSVLDFIPNPITVSKYDAVYGIYLQNCAPYLIVAKLLGKRAVVHFVGGDAYRIAAASQLGKLIWSMVLRCADIVLYVSSHLEPLVGRRGRILPLPIAEDKFQKPTLKSIQPDRDVLYYCPGGAEESRAYRLDWITAYAKDHPKQKITIIGSPGKPANYKLDLQNVEVIPYVELSRMPEMYRRHRRLIRMTTREGLSQMIHEALLSGLEVMANGRRITRIPKERQPKAFAASFRRILLSGWG